MIKYILIAATAITLISCGGNSIEQAEKVDVNKNHLEVYAFHGTRQCETCKNMKANTRSTLDKYFAQELKDSAIIFSVIDVDDAANAAIAEKYEATGTALMINWVHDGKDSIVDWSDFAFETANDENVFVPELKLKIEKVIR